MKSTLLKARYSKLAIAGLLLATACGCNSVICKRPVGEKPSKIMAKEWEGNWLGPDGAVNVKVVDADKAILSVVWLEDDGQGKPAMKTAEGRVAGIRGVALRQHRGGGQRPRLCLGPHKERG